MHVSPRKYLPVVAACVLFMARVAAASSIVYVQPPTGNTGPAWTTDVDPGGAGWQVWDDFTLTDGANISAVIWRGFYWDFLTPGNNPVAADTTSWDISFWSDAGGIPGALLQTTSLSAADVAASFVGFGTFGSDPVSVYDFVADLPSLFGASGGTTYWLSVLSHSPTQDPLFAWMPGFGPNAYSVQVNYPSGAGFFRAGDRAFALVPEPGSLALVSFGLATLLARRRVARSTR